MEKNFRALASLQDSFGHPLGLYALVDYNSFKGEGIAAAEHYNTQAWGLSELLFEMEDLRSNRPLLEKYIDRLELQQMRSDLTAENLTPLELFVLRGAKVLDDRIENNIMERDRMKGTAGYDYFLAHYGEEAAPRTPQEEAVRQEAFESLFGLPYKDNSQYRQSLFYPHLLGYLEWPSSALMAQRNNQQMTSPSPTASNQDAATSSEASAQKDEFDPIAEDFYLGFVVLACAIYYLPPSSPIALTLALAGIVCLIASCFNWR